MMITVLGLVSQFLGFNIVLLIVGLMCVTVVLKMLTFLIELMLSNCKHLSVDPMCSCKQVSY